MWLEDFIIVWGGVRGMSSWFTIYAQCDDSDSQDVCAISS